MEEAAAATREDEAEKKARRGDTTSEDTPGPSAEDTADWVGVFCCRNCGEAFREEAAYLEHRHLHLQENMYLDEQLDGLHDAEKDCETDNFCSLCSLSFVEPNEFHSHMEKNHGQTSQKECSVQINSGITKQHTYECPDCGKCYGVIGHFLNHQRSHRQASKSLFHDLEHLKKKSFQCESCGRNYSRASALDAHRRCHEEKLVKSRNRSSGEAFHTEEPTVEAKPSENQTDDTPEKPFKCLCGKAFTALLRLKTHQRFSRNKQCSPEEMKEKPKKSSSEFYCSECNKAFNGHIALFNHQRWHANHTDDSAKRFPCEECGKVFMTLTFYYRHQRTAHSNETPAKSFLHQVCQLQKKAFECKDCGLKFSRASALHSHELHHTDVFKETEKGGQMRTSLLPQENILESERKETEQEQVESEHVHPSTTAEEDSHVNETDEDGESYEPGDFNVQVISASESEDEPVQDLNPDLELLCESDQEGRDDCDTVIPHSNIISKPGMDLKIVQIDFEHADAQCAPITGEIENTTTGERFDCPECYRWFSSSSSLRVHRMWHGIHKRRQQTQVKQGGLECQDCGLTFTHWKFFRTHLHQHALEEDDEGEEDDEEEEEEAQMGVNRNPAPDLASWRVHDGENGDEGTGCDAEDSDMSSSSQAKPSGLGVGAAAALTSEEPQKVYTCLDCGKSYTYLVSFRKHQKLHTAPPPTTKSVQNLRNYDCPECGLSFIRRARLLGHLRVHESHSRCDQCNKEFDCQESWMVHVKLHERNPFWCLSCSKGFKEEAALNKHLQSHSQKQRERKRRNSFQMSALLRSYFTIHSGPKPYQCTACGKRFFHLGNLILHRKKYHGAKTGSGGMKDCAVFAKKQVKTEEKRFSLTSDEEQPGMDINMGELSGGEEGETQQQSVEFWDPANFEESYCGEPVRHFKPPKSTLAGFDAPDELRSEVERPQAGQELDQSESEETGMDKERRYWEWECCLCDVGFDEVEKLHLHYIKHATGELPIPQDY